MYTHFVQNGYTKCMLQVQEKCKDEKTVPETDTGERVEQTQALSEPY